MRNIFISKKVTGISKKDLWQYIISVESYPDYIPFLQRTHVPEKIAKGSTWYDVTTILWIPMKFRHTTLSITPQEEMCFQVHIPFRGTMVQKYFLKYTQNTLELAAVAEFHLGNKAIDMIVGPILKRRLEKMMEGSLDNLQKKK